MSELAVTLALHADHAHEAASVVCAEQEAVPVARHAFGHFAVRRVALLLVARGECGRGFAKAAQPIQDQLAKELGPHAVKILNMIREVK